jgi:subtilase family serine protease
MKNTMRFVGAAVIIFVFAGSAFAQGVQGPNVNANSNAFLNAQNHIPVCPGPAAAGDVRCNARVITDKGGTPSTSQLPAGLSPQQILSAYSLGTGVAATPTTIAIVDAYDNPNVFNDLTTYDKTFHLPVFPQCSSSLTTGCFKKVNQRGTATYPAQNASWSLEIALDVEVAHATCQNCTIVLVEADSSSYTNLMAAVDQAVLQHATVVSNSYGSNEFSGEASYDSHFNVPGVAFTFSTGDAGYGVEYPAASPYVTAVGGTSLFLTNTGGYLSESAWGGAGSGCSAIESKSGLLQTDTGCANRTVADVSAVADPNTGAAVYDSTRFQGKSGWFKVGGTSLASPLIAGVYALSGNTAGGANTIPYSTAAAASLHDVTSGSNGSCGGSYLCTAVAGFDGPTGLGTPNGIGAF